MDLIKKIKEKVYIHDFTYTQIARAVKVSNAAITKWLKGDYHLSFPNVLALVRFLFPEEELDLMGEYSLTLKNKNARLALEYCSINHLPQYDKLLDLLFEGNRKDVEWATVYSLTKIEDLQERLLELRKFKTKSIELKVYILLQEIYAQFTARKFHLIEDLSERIDVYHRNINVDFIREMYNQRNYEMKGYYMLYRAKVEECREYSERMIEVAASKFLVANGYHRLGETYLFEDYDMAKHYLEKAHVKYTRYIKNERRVLRTLNFLNFLWEKEPEHIDFESTNYTDIHCAVYYYIMRNEMGLAQQQLNRIEFNKLSPLQKAFNLYFLYKIHGKKTICMIQSVNLPKLTTNTSSE